MNKIILYYSYLISNSEFLIEFFIVWLIDFEVYLLLVPEYIYWLQINIFKVYFKENEYVIAV